ncbi:hypothetical protein [Legionella spiritensis]|uniref:hypothetical protein n=1 Tax=Legionella spiritensis TaxID=452 RepID=UPI000F6E556D|nr:hypothetical protein [Legionella spiritensis]VEG91158.1 Uncharacterised protein [Legionella spiritensis]
MLGHLTQPEYLKYRKGEKPSAQAQRVFSELLHSLKNEEQDINPDKKLALLYSANNKQAERLNNARSKNKPIPPISGSGQAQLFAHLIPLINEAVQNGTIKHEQIVVLPIATSLTGGNNNKGNQVGKWHIDRDIREVINKVQEGYEVLGCSTGNNQFAIGGLTSQHWFKDSFPELDNQTQGAYVQTTLENISNDPENSDQLLDNLTPKDDYLSLLKHYRSQGLSGEWKKLKDELVNQAKQAISVGQEVPESIASALQEHYNPVGSFKRSVSQFFNKADQPKHWQEVEKFQQENHQKLDLSH